MAAAPSPGRRLRLLLERGFVALPACYNALTAQIAEHVGFDAVYMSGGATAMTHGLPDTGLLSLTEMVQNLRFMTAATALPVVADADTGYGNAVNVFRTVREYERAGAAGLHLEDQEFPKRCGYLEGKRVIPAEEHVDRIRAACEARLDPDTVIIARTDALQVHGWDEAARRARLYHEAGADLVFVDGVRALDVDSYVERLVREGVPCLFNGADLSAGEAASFGFRAAIQPAAFYAGYRAEYESLARLRETGRAERLSGSVPVPPVTDLVGLPVVEDLESRFGPERAESAQDREWDRRQALLAAFVEREGHTDVPEDYAEDGVLLGRWVTEIRVLGNEIGGRQAILTPARREFLESLPGWKWDEPPR
jgi:2-methylisocitrate lyase-like PEP mutase family enzyme